MKIAPYIDADGIARERERAPYGLAFVTEEDRIFLGFLPEAKGLTCLEYAPIFSMALRPGTDPQEAREVAQRLLNMLEGLDAIYESPPVPKPTNPNVIELRAA